MPLIEKDGLRTFAALLLRKVSREMLPSLRQEVDHQIVGGDNAVAADAAALVAAEATARQNADNTLAAADAALDTRVDALEAAVPGTLDNLTDVDTTGVADGDVLTYDSGSGLWGPATGGAGATTFDALTDTPANKTGSALKYARVNAGETALEYAALPSASETAAGIVELATSAETTAGLAVQASDTRLTNARTPTAHASSHQHAGSDEIATTLAAANQIPKAGAGGTLADGWFPSAIARKTSANTWLLEQTFDAGFDLGSGNISAGTAFPGSPSSGDRVYRSDRGLEYYYDGSQWLSTQLFCLPWAETRALQSGTGIGTAGVINLSTFPKTPGIATASQPGIKIVDIQARILTLTTLTSSAYWILTVSTNGGSGLTTHWTQNSYDLADGYTAADTTYDYQSGTAGLSSQPAADQNIIYFQIAKNNAPGNWGGNILIYYRYIG